MENESLLIACADPADSRRLLSKIDCGALGISALAPVNSLSQLSQAVSGLGTKCPSLILSDLQFPDGDLFTLLGRIQDDNSRPRILILYAGHRFEHAYRALQYHVDAFLRPSISAERLNQELARALGLHRLYKTKEKTAALSRRDFLYHISEELFHYHNLTTDMINQRYGTAFQNGYYTALLFKLDSQDTQAMFAQMEQFYPEIEAVCSDTLAQYCCDILYDELSDSILAILNYTVANAGPLAKRIPELFQRLQTVRARHSDLSITLCISKEYSEFVLLAEAKDNVLNARWARLALGIDRIIDCRDLPFSPVDDQASKKLERLIGNIFSAYCRLDENDVHQYMDEFFQMPASFLVSPSARAFIKKCIDNLFEVYQTQAETEKDMALSERHEMIYYVNVCFSYAQMRDVFYAYTHRILDEIRNIQYTPVIREMLLYIYENYKRSPMLSEVSEQLHYSVPYLSALFKKETGQNFSDFVVSYRLEQAKKLLLDKTKSISNIAAELGYKDVRYFSKQFKRNNSLTPSAYRSLYLK